MRHFGVLALLAFILATATTAGAAAPQFQTVEVDFTIPPDPAISAQCGFPIEIHGFGTLKLSIHELQGGKVVEIDRLIQDRIVQAA